MQPPYVAWMVYEIIINGPKMISDTNFTEDVVQQLTSISTAEDACDSSFFTDRLADVWWTADVLPLLPNYPAQEFTEVVEKAERERKVSLYADNATIY